MTTTLVNIARGGVADVYIGRPGPFGNPVYPCVTCPMCGNDHPSKEETIPCFSVYFHKRVAADEAFHKAVLALRGKRLGCYCAGVNACHGEVIIAFLESSGRSDDAVLNEMLGKICGPH